MRYLSCVYVSIRNTRRRVWITPPVVAPMPASSFGRPAASPAPQARGIYRLRTEVYGEPAYYSWSSRGHVLEVYRARDGETTADIVTLLADSLERQDPARPALTVASGGRSQPYAGLPAFVPPPLRALP